MPEDVKDLKNLNLNLNDFKFERLNEWIDRRLQDRPEARCCRHEGTWLTRSDFKGLADACAGTLKAAGFDRGQRLAALMPNSPAVLALSLAVWRLGGSFCPLNEKSGEASLLKTLELLQPFAVVLSGGVKKELADALSSAGWPCVVCPENGPLPSFEGRSAAPEPDDLAVIFSTSGTTGDPKAVPLTHANLLDQCLALYEAVPSLSESDVFLNVLPNFHAFGFTVGGLLPLYIGAAQATVPGFMPPQNTLKVIRETPANILLFVPTMLGFLTSLLERNRETVRGIRLLIAGGDRYNPQMEDRVRAAFGVGVIEGYGITECSPVLAVNRIEEGTRLGTVGRALPRFELRVGSEDGGTLTKAEGSEGVLWVRGPSVTSGYYHAPEVNRERFHDGWFNTGDYVRVSEDGYIKILDRVTDILIVGGFNVYPQEVEAVLSGHPAVQTAVVVGTPNTISGEVPKAFVIKNRDASVTEPELIRFCKDRLSHYKVPRSVEFVTSLPLSSTGKILRRVLRQQEREKAGALS